MNLCKVKIAEATNLQLDWIVGTIEKAYRMRVARPIDWYDPSDNRWIVRAQVANVGWFADYPYQPSINPAQAWQILENHISELADCPETGWTACCSGEYQRGSTSLVAICRAYAVSKLGYEADVPEELV